MLIIDIPKPSRCIECPVRFICETYAKVLESSDGWEELKTCTPDEKCLIKGKLVRCGECKYHTKYRCRNDMMLWQHRCELGNGTYGDDYYCADGDA